MIKEHRLGFPLEDFISWQLNLCLCERHRHPDHSYLIICLSTLEYMCIASFWTGMHQQIILHKMLLSSVTHREPVWISLLISLLSSGHVGSIYFPSCPLHGSLSISLIFFGPLFSIKTHLSHWAAGCVVGLFKYCWALWFICCFSSLEQLQISDAKTDGEPSDLTPVNVWRHTTRWKSLGIANSWMQTVFYHSSCFIKRDRTVRHH